jgi:tRNA G46 methylase TrmB
LSGSRLLEQPAYRPLAASVARFLEPEGEVFLEIGFDHGVVLLDSARQHPQRRWLGVEIRAARVKEVAAAAPPNCLPLRMDVRTLLASGLVAGRLAGIWWLFPTPAVQPRHFTLTAEVFAGLGESLAPGGSLALVTDVPALGAWAREQLAGWAPAAPPPRGPALSRREWVAQRDALPLTTLVVRPR